LLRERVKSITIIILFIYGLTLLLLKGILPFYIFAILGAIPVVSAAIIWGLRGGLSGTFITTCIIILWYISNPEINFYKIITALFGYSLIAIVIGISTDRSKNRQHLLTEAIIKLEQVQEEIEISVRRYEELFNNMKSGVVIFDIDAKNGEIILKDLNKTAENIDGIKKEFAVGRSFTEIFPDFSESVLPETIRNVWRTGKSIYMPLFSFNGQSIRNWREIHIYSLPSKEVVIIYNDITRAVNIEENLKRFQFLFEHTQETMLFLDRKGNIIDANNAAIDSYGYSIEEFWQMNILNLFAPDSLPVHIKTVNEKTFTGVLNESIQRRKDGTIFPAEVSFEKSLNDNENLVICIMRDITAHKKALETISHMAYHDALTDLPNRELFNDRLDMAIARAERENKMFALLFLDLDNFKTVNDTMGHLSGDHLLQDVAGKLLNVVRKTDTVARMGGDEFIILQQQVNEKENVKTLAEKILKLFEKPFLIDGKKFNVTTTIGITICPRDANDAESLLRLADIALYKAKERGVNNYQFYNN